MLSDRLQRQVDRLLDQAEESIARRDWESVRESAEAVLRVDPRNPDALGYLAMAGGNVPNQRSQAEPQPAGEPAVSQPASFVDGRYEVKRLLGEGGKKRVYLAHDTKLDRDVAFALIKTDGLDEEGILRIRREAQAMGRLGDHPHIVSLFDIGEEGGQPYLVSQLMGGGDVEGLIARAEHHRVPLDLVLGIGDQVCQGLEHAHGLGIVHRDLKPGNVWLTTDGTAKLGDFGLAVALDRTRLTQAGMMVGTVSYMPPEQAMGGEVTPRSDLYSLGAMLYELVTGRPPFVGDESVAIITQHLNTPPVAPSWHVPDLPAGLEGLILRLLEKDPAKRPSSAAEVRQVLAGIYPSPQPSPARAEGVSSPPLGVGGGEGVSPVSQSPLYRRTFVGREAELRQLQGAFDGAMSGQGSLVAVVGEPGIGKTALCEQLATYATVRNGRTLVGHCYEEGSLSLPYLPFVEAIRSYVLVRPAEALRSELGSGASEVARIVSEVREKVEVEPRAAGDPEDDRWRLYQAVTGFLRNAGSVQPLVLVLEDLHWADRGTLDFLVHLSRNLDGSRLVVVGTYRDVEVDRAHPLSGTLAELRRGATFARIGLRGLTPDEVQRMLNNLTGQEVRWGLAEAVHRQTEGNPLFIQEVLRYLVEEGLITHEGGRWQRGSEGAPIELSIPEGLRDVIGKRLSRLSAECNRLLTIAAVIGRDFDLEILRRVAETDEEPLVQALEEALHVGVLEEQAARGVLRYRFAHAFFRQTLYEELSGPRRLRWHQQVARALEAQYGNRLEEHAAEMAEHFAQATDPEGLAKAVHYSRMAAGRALAVYAYGEAVRLLEQAVEVQEILAPEDRAGRCDLLLELGDALPAAGEALRAGREVAPEALQLAEALGDQARATRSCLVALDSLRLYNPTILSTSEGQHWAERAKGYAPPGTPERVRADLHLGSAWRMAGRLREGRALVSEALELSRSLGDVTAMFAAAANALVDDWLPEDQRARLRVAEEAVGWPRQGVAPQRLHGMLVWAADTFLSWGDRERAEEVWRDLDDLAARTRLPRAIVRGHLTEVIAATIDGRLEESFELAARSAVRAAEMGLMVPSAMPFRTLLYVGRAEEALAMVEHASAVMDERGVRAVHRALCLAHMGRSQEASESMRGALQEWSFAPDSSEIRWDLLPMAIEAAVLAQDREILPLLLARLAPVDVPPFFTGVFGARLTCVSRQLAAASALLGDKESARAQYERALEACQRMRFRPEIALTRLGLAELLLDEADSYQPSAVGDEPSGASPRAEAGREEQKRLADHLRAEGSAHLDFAIAEFRAMKMQPSLERALRHKGLLHA